MKKSLFGIIVCFVLLSQSVFAGGNKITLVDYKNKDKGAEVPEWFIRIHGSNPKPSDFKKIMPDYDDNQIFVQWEKGGSLSFLNNWSKNSNIQFEIGRNLQHIVSNSVSDYGSFESSPAVLEKIEMFYSMGFSNLALMGLDKIESFWGYFEEKDSKGNVVDSYYEYYDIFYMPRDIWNIQLTNSIANIPIGKSKIEKIINEDIINSLLSGLLIK